MTGLNVVTLGLAILALVTHAGILFGVTRLTRQKLLLSTPCKRRSLERQIRRETRSSEDHRQAVRSAFTNYMESQRMHTDTWPNSRIDRGHSMRSPAISSIRSLVTRSSSSRTEAGSTSPVGSQLPAACGQFGQKHSSGHFLFFESAL
jgi:hypothetical protein